MSLSAQDYLRVLHEVRRHGLSAAWPDIAREIPSFQKYPLMAGQL